MAGDDRRRRRRKRIDIELTDQAVDGLDALVTRHGITKTALIEALGQLGAGVDLPREVVDLARAVDRERRSRR